MLVCMAVLFLGNGENNNFKRQIFCFKDVYTRDWLRQVVFVLHLCEVDRYSERQDVAFDHLTIKLS